MLAPSKEATSLPHIPAKDFPRLLTGHARVRMVKDLQGVIGARNADGTVAKMVAEDPSLLLERGGHETNYTAGTLLDAAVFFNLTRTVEVGLRAGIHPDDRDAFRCSIRSGGQAGAARLIEERRSTTEQRMPGSEMVALALAHGASPDGDLQGFRADQFNSTVRKYAIGLQSFAPMAVSQVKEHLACIRLLLQANPAGIDPDVAGANREWVGFLALVGTAKALQGRPSLDSEVAGWFRDIAELALQKGAQLNFLSEDGLPQALWLARAGWSTMAGILVELGAAESWTLQPGVDPDECFGPLGIGHFKEAVLRRRLRLEAANDNAVVVAAPAPTRRRARL